MAKKKRNKKPRARQNESRVSDKSRNRKRNLILTSVLCVFVIAVVAFLVLGSDSQSSSSDTPSISVDSEENVRPEQTPTPASAGHGPSIHFPEPEFDFGSISQGDKVSHTFVVQNTGDEPLKLIRAKGSWGCTAAVLTETDIPPGGEGKIEVTFDSGHKKGQQKKTITVESNDPANPKTMLHVSALIEVQFGFELSSLDFGRLRKGETATKTAVLILKDQSKRNLLNISSQSPYITVETTNSTEPDNSRTEVQVTITPGAPVGRLSEAVTAKLTDNSHAAASLSVRGTVIGNVEITPEMIRLTADTSRSAADQAEQSVRIVSTRDDVKFRLLSVTDPSDQLSLEVDTVLAGEQYIVRARPNEKALEATRNVSGEIKISTNDTDQPVLTCRYTLIILRQ